MKSKYKETLFCENQKKKKPKIANKMIEITYENMRSKASKQNRAPPMSTKERE